MDTYRIAGFLRPEGRDRAARAYYVRDHDGATRELDSLVCPLGLAFALGYSPDAAEATEIIAMADGYPWVDVFDAVNEFIHDIDIGLIGPDDVADALGSRN